MPGILDRYVASSYLRVVVLSAVGMAGIFYISTFLDLADKVFKGQATWGMLGEYFWYATPQYVYYILPLSVLLATLVTIGLLTKNSELIVMKACGISLYRVALPMLVGGADRGQRAVRARGKRARTVQSPRRCDPSRHARRLAADVRRPHPPLGGRQRGRDLPLQLLRPPRAPVSRRCRSTSSIAA